MSWATQGYRPAKGWRKHIRRMKAEKRREAAFKEAEALRLKCRAEEHAKREEAKRAAEQEHQRQREGCRAQKRERQEVETRTLQSAPERFTWRPRFEDYWF